MRAWLSWLERRLVAPKITGSNPVVLDGFVLLLRVFHKAVLLVQGLAIPNYVW